MATAIRFENISKYYRIGLGRGSLREAISGLPGRLIGKQNLKIEDRRDFWALKDISFDVKVGEAFGIIGPNGAGKTTTLKLISNITKATSGRIEVKGRMSALIELGAGFHPELTGRENIFLNGTILGLKRQEIVNRFNDIVEFSELERFIDTPVKRYSSGMYARLGFAVAAHVDPDVLLVDEVLSVGDEAFQLKCRDFIHSFVESGKTSLFVSHNLYAVEQLCDRVMWLDHGNIVRIGRPGEVLRNYMDETDKKISNAVPLGDIIKGDRLKITSLLTMDAGEAPRDAFSTGDDLVVKIDYETIGQVEKPYFVVWISEARNNLPVFAANMLLDGFQMPNVNGGGTITCIFRNVPLMPRAYNIWIEVYGKDRSQILYKWRVVGGFRILDRDINTAAGGEERGQVRFRRAHGILKIPYEWKL